MAGSNQARIIRYFCIQPLHDDQEGKDREAYTE